MLAGKTLLAALLGRAVAEQRTARRSHNNWIHRILNAMSEGSPDSATFARSATNLTFITFNFDSVIEDVISSLVPKIYRDEGAAEAVSGIRVQHVHGRLPLPPTGTMRIDRWAPGFRQNGVSEEWVNWVIDARDRIQVVLEQIDPDLLNSVQTAIHSASVICFLGFSYHSSNLRKLGVPQSLKGDSYQHVFGSAYKLSGSARAQIEHRFDPTKIILGHSELGCLDPLNEFHILRDS